MWVDREKQRINPDGTKGEYAFLSFSMGKNQAIVDNFSRIFAKVTYETDHQRKFEEVKEEDRDYLALFGDEESEDKKSEDEVNLSFDSDFSFGKAEPSGENPEKTNKLSAALSDDSHKQLLQAHSFDRTFILDGPVVKLYKDGMGERR